jgi:hypothetical protein
LLIIADAHARTEWSDPKVSQWLYGHDAEGAVQAYFSSTKGAPQVDGAHSEGAQLNGHL